jgi:predicted  nucleic acid-binding Zn-ribbon protein
MEDLTPPEVIDRQVEQLKSLINELIEVKDGKYVAKPGVSQEKLSYALAELQKINSSYERIAKERESYFSEVTKLNKNVQKVQSQAMYLMERLGSNFFPNWYKKFLGL